MSYYVYGSSLSWSDYLQAKSFVSDISSASREAGRKISMEISRQTREVIASNEALAQENIRVSEGMHRERLAAIETSTDRITSALSEGFDRLSYGLQDISSGISELNATFHWGFGELIAGIGHMNDTLSVLIKIAKTPVQTVAFNHFEIARDAFRQGLLQEAIEELQKAIQGDHTSSGYKLEWRFHQLVGVIRLGFADGDPTLIDLPQAEQAFLNAARYAKADYPEDAGRAILSAGWAAYCQGKMKEALSNTEQAVALLRKPGEALFQAAKVCMALGEVDKALPSLNKAINLDRFYALKAAGDGDFQKHDDRLRKFLETMRKEKYQQSAPLVQAAMENIRFWREHSSEARSNQTVQRLEAFLKEGSTWPLLDMLTVIQNLETMIAAVHKSAKEAIVVISTITPGASFTEEKKYQEKETYQEEVIIKPGGLFRKPATEMQTKTRVITRARTVSWCIEERRDDIYSGSGSLITSFEFCRIQAGKFKMGEMDNQQEVEIAKDIYLGKYQVTQVQWQAVMGNNPSHGEREPNLPVKEITWNDCQQFLSKLNEKIGKRLYRLPTEQEWEYACRAGSTEEYCFGNEASRLREYGWYDKNSDNKIHPVGKLKPNSWGFYDMHGNVWEWCEDWYDSSRIYRVVRGGSCYSLAEHCRSAYRYNFGSSSGTRRGPIGFRLASAP